MTLFPMDEEWNKRDDEEIVLKVSVVFIDS